MWVAGGERGGLKSLRQMGQVSFPVYSFEGRAQGPNGDITASGI